MFGHLKFAIGHWSVSIHRLLLVRSPFVGFIFILGHLLGTCTCWHLLRDFCCKLVYQLFRFIRWTVRTISSRCNSFHNWKWFDAKGGNRIRTCCSVSRPVRCDNLIIRLVLFIREMIGSVLKNSFFFHFILDIYLQKWRKSTSPLRFRENKGIVLYNFTRKTKVSCYKRSREK